VKFTYHKGRLGHTIRDKSGEGVYLWRFEGVVCWEMDCEEEDAAGIWTVTLHTG
jgi:hypothetical protein